MDPAIFELNSIPDDPRFEGFAWAGEPASRLGRDSFDEDFYPAWGGKWAVTSLAEKWRPIEVTGRVRPFNDFPCVELTPAFSRRAVDVLGDFLRPNGELLPLKSKVGEYYAYNLHTVADILDKKKSTVTRWSSPTLADHISHVVLKRKTLGKLSIFYLKEKADCALVTSRFVERVQQYGLNGFDFRKVWPLPKGTDWRMEYAKARRRKSKVRVKGKLEEIKRHSVVLFLTLKGKSPSAAEKKRISEILNDLDAQLIIPALDAPYFGSLEGHDFLDGDCRIFLSCPDATALREKIGAWISLVDWNGGVSLVLRHGDLFDEDAREEWMEVK